MYAKLNKTKNWVKPTKVACIIFTAVLNDGKIKFKKKQ